jgi:hypothetical protein
LSQRRKRVQVKVEAADGVSKISHNHSDEQGWSRHLTDAFGTTSQAFASLLITQATNAVSVPQASLPQTMNGLLAAIDGAQPKDEIEAMLVSQMAVTHSLAMEFLGRAKRAEYVPQLEASGNLAVKLLRTYTAQVEALAKLRRGGEQTVRVEHVHVYPGGQAIVGSVTPAGGATLKSEDQPYAKQLAYAPGTPMPREDTRDTVRVARDEERPVPDARRAISRSTEGK